MSQKKNTKILNHVTFHFNKVLSGEKGCKRKTNDYVMIDFTKVKGQHFDKVGKY